MRPLIRLFPLFFLAPFHPLLGQQLPSAPPVTPDMLRPHVEFLAADALAGRATGSPGADSAAAYIAAQYRRIGLEPAAEDGSYFQSFHMYRVILGGDNRLAALRGADTLASGRYLGDFAFQSDSRSDAAGPLLFLGYGIDDSTWQQYSDYEGVSVRGSVVLLLGGVPQPRDSARRASFEKSRWRNLRDGPSFAKIAAARQAGAAAVLVVDGAGDPSIRRASQRSAHRPALLLKPPSPASRLCPVILVSRAFAERLLAGSGRSLEALQRSIDSTLRPASFVVPGCRVELRADSRIDTVRAANVAGRLPGRDGRLRGQAVVFSAHYDHLGTRADGEVYNGADDDASGTAAVIALAESFMAAKTKPRRTLLFLCVTGEEIGLVGSGYYAANPLIPLDSTVCDLNIDMIGRWDPAHDTVAHVPYVYVIGSDKISSALDSLLRERNAATTRLALDYTYNDENHPEMMYYRSDHYSFAQRGVPVIFFHTGEHADYHKVTDDAEKIDYEQMTGITTLIQAVGSAAADSDEPLSRTRRLPDTGFPPAGDGSPGDASSGDASGDRR